MISATAAIAAEPSSRQEQATVAFKELDKEKCPPRFKLADHEFDYDLQWQGGGTKRYELANLTFPSPVKTPSELNNTVHCEYYRAKQDGKRPAKGPQSS